MASYNRGSRGFALHYTATTPSESLTNLFAKDDGSTSLERRCDVADEGDVAVGVIAAVTGAAASVVIAGHCLLRVAAASPNIAPGDLLTIGEGGVGVKAGDGDAFFAIAHDAATVNGAIINATLARGVVPSA